MIHAASFNFFLALRALGMGLNGGPEISHPFRGFRKARIEPADRVAQARGPATLTARAYLRAKFHLLTGRRYV